MIASATSLMNLMAHQEPSRSCRSQASRCPALPPASSTSGGAHDVLSHAMSPVYETTFDTCALPRQSAPTFSPCHAAAVTPRLQSPVKLSSVVAGLGQSVPSVHIGMKASEVVGVGCGCHGSSRYWSRPSVFQAGHIPSRCPTCECYALSSAVMGSGWSLLLLSSLLSVRRRPYPSLSPMPVDGQRVPFTHFARSVVPAP